MKTRKVRVAAAVTVVATLALAGCSSSSGDSGSGGSAGSSGSSGKKTISFWGWAPGYAQAVKEFNATHPDLQIDYQQVQPGAKGGYQKMLNAVSANNAPCLAQVGYETLPSFAAQGALQDVSKYADADRSQFQASAWKSVSIGSAVYGAPVDIGPMVMFYNRQLFDQLGLKPPTTWAEYQQDAVKIHKANANHYITSPYLDYDYAGFDWQADASWFGTSGNNWTVSINSAGNQKVAAFWNSMVAQHLVSSAPMYDQSWYNGLGNGDIATVVGAVWQAGILKGSVAAGKGKWAVAPMPQWTAGADEVGNSGGSSTAVLKGCKDSQAAWQFADWMSTDRTAFNGLVTTAGLYPAATSLANLPALSSGDPYFGGQNIFTTVQRAAANVNSNWTWGPVMTTTAATFDDQISKAWAGTQSFSTALNNIQSSTVSALKAQGLSVAN
ncbi:ABC transporter substrate-binding protein [Rudaeicoccus suwonensis]|uniref:Multiple sugar transport system substrate-binding protein n=1 Tax=Rudaeicoccus suwonensis TaxID=657409 RepID=A0A561E0V1_9MICO|nr:sugar ABC transporter substrate-binding protein [Rudaeicoccus suwonensis]TWE09266.1 multiple sugar transport system substrate-binding protein [Rudaeicoccus suwonensis]